MKDGQIEKSEVYPCNELGICPEKGRHQGFKQWGDRNYSYLTSVYSTAVF